MTKKVSVEKKILIANEEYADANRSFFAERNICCLNMISSPGSGKTTILVKTIELLKEKLNIGVIEGDIQTEIDAERIRATKAQAIQINTEGACHLSAAQVSWAMDKLNFEKLGLVVIENVGNLVCPSAFELGENAKVVVLSVAEGDDKPVKYPHIFAHSKALVINKIDLLEGAAADDFSIARVEEDVKRLNPDIKIFTVSAKTGVGMSDWCEWLCDLKNPNVCQDVK